MAPTIAVRLLYALSVTRFNSARSCHHGISALARMASHMRAPFGMKECGAQIGEDSQIGTVANAWRPNLQHPSAARKREVTDEDIAFFKSVLPEADVLLADGPDGSGLEAADADH
jgi:hypothetical protein